jgi:hypothetical protein
MAAFCALFAALAAQAQTDPNSAERSASTEPFNLRYQSPMVGYQPYADASIESWPESNQTVQSIGGWKAYAKESSTSAGDQKSTAHQNHSVPMQHSHGEHK